MAAIQTCSLGMVYQSKGREVQALAGIDLEVLEGTVFGFLGPNGAGKTTTMHILLGFVEQTEGEAYVFGESVRKSIARQRIGYLPEHPQTYPFLTGEELLRMSGRLFGLPRRTVKDRTRRLLEAVGLSDARSRRIGAYSRGMLQRIGLAQALINDPDLVILDEPTSGLDPVARMEIRALISWLRKQGKTVFFSSHELSEVEMVCDHVAILSNGRIAVQGSAPEMVRFGDSLEHYFLGVVQSGTWIEAEAS